MTGRPHMTNPAGLIQIFHMPDLNARGMTADLLAGAYHLAVEPIQNGHDGLLVVEVRDELQASMVSRMVLAADPKSILLHTCTGPKKPPDLATYILGLEGDARRRAVAR